MPRIYVQVFASGFTRGVEGGPQLGDLTFTPSPDHASATNYEARIRAQGSDPTVLGTVTLGVPALQSNGQIRVNIAGSLTALGPGNYEVSVAVTTPGGTTDSAEGNAFTVPLIPA